METRRSLQIFLGVCCLYLATADLVLFAPAHETSYQITRTRRQAPNVNVHTIPKTSFSCQDKKLGEYYADPEARCQVYHICLAGGNGRLSPMSFVCPNGTIFSQASRVCNSYEKVYCQIAEQFYETLHGDLHQHRQDYANPNDYVNLRLPNVPRVSLQNNIDENGGDDDYYDEPAPRTTTTQAPRRNRPSNSRTNSRPAARPAPTTTLPPPPPPPQPAAPQGFRRQAFVRPPPQIITTLEPEDTTVQPARPNVVRRPVYRNPPVRPDSQPQAEPETEPAGPQNPPFRNVAAGARVRGVIRPAFPAASEDNTPSPPPPPPSSPPSFIPRQPVLRQPLPALPAPGSPPQPNSQIGIVLRGPALPTDRLPPGLRGIARPVAFAEATESTLPPTQLPPRPALLRPGLFRPAGIQRPTTLAASTTLLPTTLPPTTPAQDETTAGTQAYEYDYVYDYDFNPQQSGNTRSKRDSEREYRVSRYPPVVDTSRTPVLTDFSCQGKLTGFVYADVQTDCEMFHICIPVGKGKTFDYRLFCANNTAFNQRLGICDDKDNFKCSVTEKYYRHDKMGRYLADQKPVYDKFRLPRQVEKDLKEERIYPQTSFSCSGKTVGGYYADPDTDCQMFHICAPGLGGHATDLKFMCSNGTTFNQKTLVCDQEGQVQCRQSEEYYINNYTYFLEQERRRVEEEKVPIRDVKYEILRKEKTEKTKEV